jgi:hypothetical protein
MKRENLVPHSAVRIEFQRERYQNPDASRENERNAYTVVRFVRMTTDGA